MTLDPRDLRTAFGRFMTGVTVVTGRGADGALIGFTANSFTSVSLDPPLLLVCPGKHLSSFEGFARAETFAVSVLSEGQEALSNTFARSKGDRFAETEWQADLNGNALFSGRAAGFSCAVHSRIDAGDHLILMGRVLSYDHADKPGLGYAAGGYFSLSKERQAEQAAKGDTVASVVIEGGGQVWLTASGDLPTLRLSGRTGARSALKDHLAAQGIGAKLGPVYSIYDDAGGTHHIVLRAKLTGDAPGLQGLPLDPLPPIAPGPLADILLRFAAEHRQQNFTLYVGSADQGEIHDTTGD